MNLHVATPVWMTIENANKNTHRHTYRSVAAGAVLAALACLSLPNSARAFPVAAYAAAAKIYYGGSTTMDDALELIFIDSQFGICDPTIGDIDIYRSANQRVITCYASNDYTPGHGFAPRPAGTAIAFHKESEGGSSNGVTALLDVAGAAPGGHKLRWLDVGATNCLPPVTVAVNGTSQSYRNHAGCALTPTPADTVASSAFDIHGGISDVEPALSFPTPNFTAVNTSLDYDQSVAIIFGVPVTTALYRALQKARFGNGSACDGADTLNCVPSFDYGQVRALISQSVVDWNDFKSVIGVALTAVPGVIAPTDEFVRICRQVATSGAQAAFETFLLNERCVSGVPVSFAPPDDASTITDTFPNHQNDFVNDSLVNVSVSAENVRTCLADANGDNFWAIGVHSTLVTDSAYNGGNAGFRFVGLTSKPENLAAPNLTNVANGAYEFFTENRLTRILFGLPGYLCSVNDPVSATCPAGAATLLQQKQRGVLEAIASRFGTTAALAILNSKFDGRPWGNGGLLSLPNVPNSNTAPYSDAEMSANPINTQSRVGNNCVPPFMVREQKAGGG